MMMEVRGKGKKTKRLMKMFVLTKGECVFDAMRERERDQGSFNLSCDSVVGVTGHQLLPPSSLVRSGLATEECNEIDENRAA
jgi:hypothetical protein